MPKIKEELESRLLKYLDYLEDVGKKGAEFIGREAPETVRQFVKWEIVSCSINAMLLGAIVVAIPIAYYLLWVAVEGIPNDGAVAARLMGAIVGGCALLGFSVGTYDQFMCAMKSFIAPNVFLIETANQLRKGNRG